MSTEEYQVKMKEWKDATWQFLLEHCKILPSGKIRVIFDTNGQNDFQKRVWARYKKIYSRGDYKATQETSQILRKTFTENKEQKRAKYMDDKIKRRQADSLGKLPKWKKTIVAFILRI